MEQGGNHKACNDCASEKQGDEQTRLLRIESVVLNQRPDPDGQCHHVNQASAVRYPQRDTASNGISTDHDCVSS
ncbi:hypothetical protein D3C72_1873530 [compost metagenome]